MNKKTKLKSRPYKGKSLLSFPNEYIVLDLETTGFQPRYEKIIEIAAIKVRNGKIIEIYNQLVNQKQRLNYYIIELTGISDQMLKGQPLFKEIAEDLYNFLGEHLIIGHNVNFDINFLYDNFKRVKIKFKNDFIDLMRISRKLSPEFENHKLITIIDNFNIQHDTLHRALSDVYATHQCYLTYCDMASYDDGVFKRSKKVSKK